MFHQESLARNPSGWFSFESTTRNWLFSKLSGSSRFKGYTRNSRYPDLVEPPPATLHYKPDILISGGIARTVKLEMNGDAALPFRTASTPLNIRTISSSLPRSISVNLVDLLRILSRRPVNDQRLLHGQPRPPAPHAVEQHHVGLPVHVGVHQRSAACATSSNEHSTSCRAIALGLSGFCRPWLCII